MYDQLTEITLTVSVDGDASITAPVSTERISCFPASYAPPAAPPTPPWDYNTNVYEYDGYGDYGGRRLQQNLGTWDLHPAPRVVAQGAATIVSEVATNVIQCRATLDDFQQELQSLSLTFCPPCLGREYTFTLSTDTQAVSVQPVGWPIRGSNNGRHTKRVPFASNARRELRGRALIWQPVDFQAKTCESNFNMPACQYMEELTLLEFPASGIAENNLGGFGPDFDKPHHLRIAKVGHAEDGTTELDMIITNTTTYYPGDKENVIEDRFLVISFGNPHGGSVETWFKAEYVKTGTLTPVELQQVRLEIFDLDGIPRNNWKRFSEEWEYVAAQEASSILDAGNYHRAVVTPDTTIDISADKRTFKATKPGTAVDNPTSPSMLTAQQKQRSLSLTYVRTNHLSFSLGIHMPNGGPTRPRLFYLFLGASALYPVCLKSTLVLDVKYDAHTRSFGSTCEDTEVFDDATMTGLGAYAVQAAFPPDDASGFSAKLHVQPHPAQMVSGTTYTLERVHPVARSWQQGSPVYQERLETAWLIPLDKDPRAEPLAGRIIATDPLAALCASDCEGALQVALYPGVGNTDPSERIAVAETDADGAFAFAAAILPLKHGMYTLHVTPGGTAASLQLAANTFTVLSTDVDIVLDVLVRVPEGLSDGLDEPVGAQEKADIDVSETQDALQPSPAQDPYALHAILSWDHQSSAKMSLRLAFPLEGGSGSCDVFPALPRCGGAVWHRAEGRSSQSITVSDFAKDAAYSFFAMFGQRTCRGYSLPSSPLIAGGADTVDCVGDCSTGRGYCYSTNDAAYCANCVLWEPDVEAGEVLCTDYGKPQSGLLPETRQWRLQGSGQAKKKFSVKPATDVRCDQAGWQQSGEERRYSILQACSSRLLYSRARLRLVQQGVTIATIQLAGSDDTILPGNGGYRASWLTCMKPTGGTTPALGLGTRATIPDNPGLAPLLDDTGLTCEQRVESSAQSQWACGTTQWNSQAAQVHDLQSFACDVHELLPLTEPERTIDFTPSKLSVYTAVRVALLRSNAGLQ